MKENVRKFIEELDGNEKAQEMLKAMPVDGAGPDAAALARVARETGYDVTEEDIRACIEEERKIRAAASDAVAEKLGELEPEDMEAGAGGGENKKCCDTYKAGEWCWSDDSCSKETNLYGGSVGGCIDTFKYGEWCWGADSCEFAIRVYNPNQKK